MLACEWRELESLCDRISGLRHRYVTAQRSKNAGLLEGLKSEIAHARRQREHLVKHISARLSVAVAERYDPDDAAVYHARQQDSEPAGSTVEEAGALG